MEIEDGSQLDGIAASVKNRTLSGIEMPTRMPMIPPAMLITTDSVRNCSSTACREAPTAMRRPISRVRSVTVTSMMFMMPIPEITSAMVETRISTIVMTSAILLRGIQNRRQIFDVVARARAMPALQQLLDRRGQRPHVGSLPRLNVHRIDALNRSKKLHHGDGHQYGFVGDFGYPEGARPLLERPHHGELQIVQLDHLAHGVLHVAVQLARPAFR